jgi:hypothetical protein
MVFLDAATTCLILVKRDVPINPVADNHGGVHHAFAIAHDDYGAALDHSWYAMAQAGTAPSAFRDRPARQLCEIRQACQSCSWRSPSGQDGEGRGAAELPMIITAFTRTGWGHNPGQALRDISIKECD